MKKKIKLVFFHPYSLGGGSDNSLFRLIKKLDYKLYDIKFISLNRSILKKKLKYVEFITLKSSRTIFSIFKMKEIVNYEYKKYKKIILISNQHFANIISIFIKILSPHIKLITIDRNHLDELNFYDNFIKFVKNKIILIMMKLFYQFADKRIGICKKLSQDLSKLTKCNVQTIYSPSFDKSIIKLSRKKNVKLKGFNKFIICVSRFSKRKDHETLIKGFAQVKNKKNYKLILVGFGAEEKNIRLKIKDNNLSNQVKIIKNLHNPFWLMRKASLSIITSIYEGFPNVLVESLTLNTPAISTNMNAGASEILLNGKGGDLIKIGDYKVLSQKIQNFIDNPKTLNKKLQVAKKNLFRFDINRHHKIYNKIFKNV